MLQLLETGKALYVLAGICMLGIFTRMMTRHLYKRFIKESANLALTKNRSLQKLRQKAESTYRTNQGMADSGAWLEHQLFEMKAFGVSLPAWSGLCQQWTWLCLLAGGIGAFFSYWYRLDTYYIVMYGGGAVLMAMATMLFDNGAAGGWRERLLAVLQDHLENVMFPRLARSHVGEAGRSEGEIQERTAARGTERLAVRGTAKRGAGVLRHQRGKRGAEAAAGTEDARMQTGAGIEEGAGPQPGQNQTGPEPIRDVDYLKKSLEQIAASREKSRALDENWLRDLKPQEVELIGDILKQYLA